MALRRRSDGGIARRLLVAGAAAAIGALPSIWAAATGHRTAIPSSPAPYLSRLGTFFSHVLPMILGLRIEGAGVWELGHRIGPVVYALLLVVVAGAAILVAAGNRDARVLVLALALFPFLYAAFPTSWFWNDGRYAIGLTPVVALVVVGALWQAVRPATAVWLACAALRGGIRHHLGGLQLRLRRPRQSAGSPGGRQIPTRPSPRWRDSSSRRGRPTSTPATGWRTT